jgi:RHS repeat-associated protein
VAGALPLLLDDGNHAYLYGPSLTPVAQVDGNGDIEYLHADLIGSVRLITDDTGAVTGSNAYDAFGNRTHTGTADSAFGYTGNWTDPGTGLLYLRARDYDPATGQFLAVDPAVDSTRQPYAYTATTRCC